MRARLPRRQFPPSRRQATIAGRARSRTGVRAKFIRVGAGLNACAICSTIRPRRAPPPWSVSPASWPAVVGRAPETRTAARTPNQPSLGMAGGGLSFCPEMARFPLRQAGSGADFPRFNSGWTTFPKAGPSAQVEKGSPTRDRHGWSGCKRALCHGTAMRVVPIRDNLVSVAATCSPPVRSRTRRRTARPARLLQPE